MTPSDHMSEKYIRKIFNRQLTRQYQCPAPLLTCSRADEVIIDNLWSHKLRSPNQALDLQ